MKIIFTSPFNPLWSNGVSEIASLLDAKVVSIGDLLRAEVKSNSVLGKEIESGLQSGQPLGPSSVSELLSHRFLDDSARKILVNYPLNSMQAESLAEYVKSSAHTIRACVVVNASKESTIKKFESQFHCVDSFHPKLESSESNPVCGICGKAMIRSYDLKNYKVAHLINSYFDENGVLSAVSILSRILGVEAVSYTTPKEVTNKILGLSHGNV